MIEFAKEIIVPTPFNPNPDIPRNNNNSCIHILSKVILTISFNVGAIGAYDGTLIHDIVPIQEQHLYRGGGKGLLSKCFGNL